jgi:hypothetical protein
LIYFEGLNDFSQSPIKYIFLSKGNYLINSLTPLTSSEIFFFTISITKNLSEVKINKSPEKLSFIIVSGVGSHGLMHYALSGLDKYWIPAAASAIDPLCILPAKSEA